MAAMMMSTEWKRRAAVRTPVQWPVEWSFRGELGLEGRLCDVSEHGVFLAPDRSSSVPPKCGDELSMLVTKGEDRFLVEGWVRWLGRHEGYGRGGFGVAFHPMSAYVGEALAYALTAHLVSTSGVFPALKNFR